MLRLSNISKSYEIETQDLDVVIGKVFLQDDHLIAYESRKLSDVEKHYSTHEKQIMI